MTKDELIDYTKTLVNEISPTDGLPIPVDGFADDRPLTDMLLTLLPEATRSVLLEAPPEEAPMTSSTLSTSRLAAPGYALWTKPADYLRLLRVRLPHWGRPVVEVVPEDSLKAQWQYNPYLRAGTAKPVVVESGHHLQLWPATQAEQLIAQLAYVPLLPAEELSVPLQYAVCRKLAERLAQVTGNR